MANFEKDLEEEQREVNEQKGPSRLQVKRWKTKQGVFQLKDPTPMDQVEPSM